MMKIDIYSLVSLECRKDIRWPFFNCTLQEKEAGVSKRKQCCGLVHATYSG